MRKALLIIEVDGLETILIMDGTNPPCKTLWYDETSGNLQLLHNGCWVTLKEILYVNENSAAF